MLLLAPSDGAIRERLISELADVELRFASELNSDLICVNDLIQHVERYRGKMFRPTLTLVAAMACEPDRNETDEAHRVVATVVEMIHMATLVHDDILDEARLRRRGATINHLAGNEAAVMLGDYLISHAYHLCSVLDQPWISRLLATTTNTICEGELLQLANRNNWTLDERIYFDIIGRKTASLCGTCSRLAAVLSRTDESVAQGLTEYGQKVGVAYQIIDDVLDLTGDPQVVGKTLGRDLETGKLTLPLIHELTTAEPSQRDQLLKWLKALDNADQTDQDRNHLVFQLGQQLVSGAAVGYARQQAVELVNQAKAAVVDQLPESDARTLLLDMADAILDRGR